jgi:pre-mRNA-processing factor 40
MKEVEPDKEREPTYRTSKHHREADKVDRRRERKSSRSDYDTVYGGRDWEEAPAVAALKEEKSEPIEAREKRDCDDGVYDNRGEKVSPTCLN